MTSYTTIILVPGAWHTPDCFSSVSALLQQAGYKTELVNLPSVGPAKHLANFDADVEAIRSAIQKASDEGQNVILVGHSYGSIPANEAVKDLDLMTRRKEGKRGGVQHIFFMAAFIVAEGHSLIGAFGGNPLPWFKVSEDQMEVNPDTPDKIFYNDLSEDVQTEMIAKLKPFSYQCMHTPVTYAAWKHVPSTYLYCTLDQAIPLQIQQMMVEETGKGAKIDTQTVEAGHSPFLGKPEKTAIAIRKAAGESL